MTQTRQYISKILSDKIAMEFLIRHKKLQEKGKCMISFQLKTPLQLKTLGFGNSRSNAIIFLKLSVCGY